MTGTDAFNAEQLKSAALRIAGTFSPSAECTGGSVGAALLSQSGELFTGICLDSRCSLGFCAEQAAIAEMIKRRQTRIIAIVAVSCEGEIMAPCGRCRELIRQLDPGNWRTRVILAATIVTLSDLLPHATPVGPGLISNPR